MHLFLYYYSLSYQTTDDGSVFDHRQVMGAGDAVYSNSSPTLVLCSVNGDWETAAVVYSPLPLYVKCPRSQYFCPIIYINVKPSGEVIC